MDGDMKILLALFGLLLITQYAFAFDLDKNVAQGQPCLDTVEAIQLLKQLQSGCAAPPLKIYVNICKGQQVNSPAQGLVTQTTADTAVPDMICMPKGFKAEDLLAQQEPTPSPTAPPMLTHSNLAPNQMPPGGQLPNHVAYPRLFPSPSATPKK
jgi:hypothetical protein